MNFTVIDRQNWPRSQIFHYFSTAAPTSFSLTVDMDITKLKTALNHANLKFFPAYLWLITKNLNRQTEFKTAVKDGVLGYYETLTPLYAHFHTDSHTFSLMWTEYSESFHDFHRGYIDNKSRFGDNPGLLCQPETPPPENAYTVSCIPWVRFRHFAVHNHDNKPYYFPSVEAGKFFEEGHRICMPLSLTCHHAATDGYHIRCFLDSLQQDMDNFHRFI